MKVNVEFEVTNQMIIDQFITAFEGGSNYWFELGDLVNARPRRSEEAFSEYIAHLVIEDHPSTYIPVKDTEEDMVIGSISLADVNYALQHIAIDYPRHFNAIINESGDAETADVFLQYVVLGEIVYG